VNIEFKNAGKPVETLFSENAAYIEAITNDVKTRAGEAGQFLNWIGVLPRTQLANIDNIYDLVEKAKNGGKFSEIAILGIGGSRHTTEAIAKMLNLDSKMHFYSAIDAESFKRFINKIDLEKTLFMVVSKSGGTLETTTAYENVKLVLENRFGKEEARKHFVAMTDKDASKSKLRTIVEAGDILLSGLVHDDVGGRFSIFDDATLFALAFCGMTKEQMKELLEGSLKAQEAFLSDDININKAAQQAVFNAEARKNGKIKHFVELFGDAFEGEQLWEKQLKNESLKERISTDTNVGPAYLHYNAESDLAPGNNDSFYTFVYVKPEDNTTKAVLSGVIKAYSGQHPVSCIELSDLSPKSVAEFIELKHFETIFTGMLLRKDEKRADVLPEVLQPNVEKYKKEVKEAMKNLG